MKLFDFKRGDTVRICLVTYDKHGPGAQMIGVDEAYGIVLSVDATKQGVCTKGIGQVEVRRDNDGALFTVDLNGQSHNVSGEQYCQVQKCFSPVSSYKGTLVEWLEFIAHPTPHGEVLQLTVVGYVDGKPFHQEVEEHFMDAKMHLDLSKSRIV